MYTIYAHKLHDLSRVRTAAPNQTHLYNSNEIYEYLQLGQQR